MTMHVVSLGDLVVDLIAPIKLPVMPFDHQESGGAVPEPGGSGNFMILGARLGMQVSSIGTVGDDLFGRFLCDNLSSEGVNIAGIVRVPDANSTLVLDLIDRESGQHVFIGSSSKAAPVEYTPLMNEIIGSAGAVFLQGYTLLEKANTIITPKAIDAAKQRGIPVYFDVGPTVRHTAIEELDKVIQQTDVVMMTEDEVPLAAHGQSGKSAYEWLLSQGPHTLVVKQGKRGCTIVQSDGHQAVPGFAVPVVDTVGAGDCFDAAFIYARLAGQGWVDTARFANAIGAASVQKLGAGRNVPTCEEMNAVFQQNGVWNPLSC
ncbi:MAG: carbohydrate kinase family protein [Anaerolineae bacterium]